jgi:DNA topoisomerase-1
LKTCFILAEKPDAALRIAEALSEKEKPRQFKVEGVPFYEVRRDSERILIGSALGHLYEVDAKDAKDRREYPVFDYTWKPRYLVERGQVRHERWLRSIAEVSKKADEWVNGCDYDTEGSLIGYMILRYACGVDQKAKRMKFSTLTTTELREAYENLLPTLDLPLVEAGMCRHEVDWLYGVNLSRALTEAVRVTNGGYATLSTGRVQGPTLRFVVDREKEIGLFVPIPYWRIEATVKVGELELKAQYSRARLQEEAEAHAIATNCMGKQGIIERIEVRDHPIAPPVPFNLSGLQAEAYRLFKLTPRQTLAIAERLYLDALISYPRTSSQKLPYSIGYRELLKNLSKLSGYSASAFMLLQKPILKPNEGPIVDPAHPAIYPTGNYPRGKMDEREARIYDLIVKRFMASFGDTALKRSMRAVVKVDDETFYLNGSRFEKKGWICLYEPYAKMDEAPLPYLQVGDKVDFVRVIAIESFTEPPPRFNPSSLLQMMEDHGIGTKATRADIIETLFQRGYLSRERIVPTPLAFAVVDVLREFCAKILDVNLTRELEESMENIQLGKETKEQVVARALSQLRPILMDLKSNQKEIGALLCEMIRKTRISARTMETPCPLCGSKLQVIRSRSTGKRFIGCSGKWVNGCSFALPLPQFGKLTLLDRKCVRCGFQMVKISLKGRRPLFSCPRCYKNQDRRE